jgi:hypothetical protein
MPGELCLGSRVGVNWNDVFGDLMGRFGVSLLVQRESDGYRAPERLCN